jgi:Protein of unknown function (DUF2971)
VWRNLLKHYALCLLNVAPACFVGGEEFDKDILRNVVSAVPAALPDAPIRSIYERVAKEFLDDPLVKEFVDRTAARSAPIRRYELTYYLRNLHAIALHAVLKEFAAFGVVKSPTFMSGKNPDEFRRNVSKAMEGAANLPDIPTATEWSAETFFSLNDSLVSQMHLYREYQVADRANARPLALLTHYFPSSYVSALERLVHPDLYLACFSATATNASMWGQYGRGHRGVCLKFRMTPSGRGNPSLAINRVVGASAALGRETTLVHQFVPSECLKVEYAPRFPSIDFFTSLGALSQEKLYQFWYKGEDDGDFSACTKEAFKDQAARDDYWKAFEAGALCKTPDWKHEEEYRILLHSGFPLQEKPQRKLEYRFEDLSGIVFGARTDLEDKLRIMRIIDRKCAKARRSDFEFYEIRFMPETSTFTERKLDLVKIRYD